MDSRLKNLADQLDAGLIARREFLKKAAVITGGTAAGLHALRGMAPAQAKTKLRVWLFKSFVTAGNDVVSRHVEAWAPDKNASSISSRLRPSKPYKPVILKFLTLPSRPHRATSCAALISPLTMRPMASCPTKSL